MAKGKKRGTKPKKPSKFCAISYAKGALRRATRRTPAYSQCMNRGKIVIPQTKKNGEPSKKYLSFFPCEICGEEFKRNEVEVDHIDPIVPVDRDLDNFEEWVTRWGVDQFGLQRICKPCHKDKTSLENTARAAWKREKKLAEKEAEIEQEKDV